MGSGSTPVYALDSDDDDASTNRSISELISTLRIAYRSKSFDRVEAKLVARETRLKREIEDAKKENALLKDALDVAREKERRAEERYEKLLEEMKKGQQEEKSALFELRRKNCELECAIAKAESNAEFWKSRFGEFEIRISKLEEDYAMLVNDEANAFERFENVNKVNAVHVTMEDDAFDCDGNTSAIKGNTDLQNAASERFASRATVDIIDSDEDCALGGILCGKEMSGKKFADNAHSGPTVVKNGTTMLKRKRDSCVNVSEKDVISLIDPDCSTANNSLARSVSSGSNNVDKRTVPLSQNQVILRQIQEKVGARNLMHDFILERNSGDSSSESDAEANVVLDKLAPIVKRKKDNQKWEFDDMCAEFEKDPELCLKAVCALYRQQTCVRKSPLGLPFSSNQGFDKSDALR
ncbi:hypothetical protein FH972_012844 [Carpinus fangiana]|nr:hypothetical protein FH972_012844 [Carpinus fangiana]